MRVSDCESGKSLQCRALERWARDCESASAGRPRNPVHRWIWLIAGTFLCMLPVACERLQAHHDLGFLNRKFVTGDGVRVYPDRHWRSEDGGGMSFRKVGVLLVWVEGEAPQVLRGSFVPEGETSRFHFMALWDDAQLWEQPRTAEGQPLVAEVPSEALTPGLHRLAIERVKLLDEEGDRARAVNSFSRVECELVRDGESAPVPITGDAFIASFLDFGVTGQSLYRLGGCLFDGPQGLVNRFTCDGESQASFILVNRSCEPAIFTVVVGGREPLNFAVPARGSSPIDFEVPPGEHELVLEVAGQQDGSFLWGTPHLQRSDADATSSVFFITLDTTRWDSVAPFSADPELTPNIAGFARGASVFRNAWAVAPWTLPSHASMFTGLYPSHHGAGVTGDVLDGRWVTLAERFRDEGYRTAGFIGGLMSSSSFGVAQGFSVYHDPEGWSAPGDLVTDSALDFIAKHASSPLFVFINYFDPHEPYSAPAEFERRAGVPEAVRSVSDLPIWSSFARGESKAWGAIKNGKASDDPRGFALLRAVYRAEVGFMDSQIGRLFDELRELEIFDDALIVLVADHGEFLGERGRYAHAFSLDPVLTKVPLIIKWPRQRTGTEIEELVSHVDLYPSVASAVEIDVPPSDGRLFSRDAMSALERRAFVLMEEHTCRLHPLLGSMYIADHLIGFQWRDRRDVLFDGRITCDVLRDDAWYPVECDAGWEERTAMLGERMRAAARLSADYEVGDLDPEEAKMLRALGYVE